MFLNLIQWNIHFSTIKDARESGISKHALDGFASVFEVTREWMTTGATFSLSAVSFSRNSIKTKFTDLLSAVQAIFWLNGKAVAVWACKVAEMLVLTCVQFN